MDFSDSVLYNVFNYRQKLTAGMMKEKDTLAEEAEQDEFQ